MRVVVADNCIAFEAEDRVTSIWDDGTVMVETKKDGFWTSKDPELTAGQWRHLANIADKLATEGGA